MHEEHFHASVLYCKRHFRLDRYGPSWHIIYVRVVYCKCVYLSAIYLHMGMRVRCVCLAFAFINPRLDECYQLGHWADVEWVFQYILLCTFLLVLRLISFFRKFAKKR